MNNQKSLCCYADIKLTGSQDHSDAFECVKCGRIIGAKLPVKRTEELVEEALKNTPRYFGKVGCGPDNPVIHLSEATKALTQLAKAVENNVHEQSALEAKGRKVKINPLVPDGSSTNIPRVAFNQALTDLADYHRSKVIE